MNDGAIDRWVSRSVDAGDGVTLAAQALGPANAPALLLLAGATWSRDWWLDDLCVQLAERGMRVLRFDTRDTGGSTIYPPGEPGYTGADLVDDAAAVLDAFQVDRAFIMGLSMGGGVAQDFAARYRERTAGLILLSTSPADNVARDLPGPTPEIRATFDHPIEDPDWTDRSAVIDWVVESERPYAGPGNFDESGLRELAGRVWDRTPSMASGANHFLAAEGDAPVVDLAALSGIPTLVVHGSADPVFPVEHGRALAEAIPGARFHLLRDVGHQVPPRHTWPDLVEAIAVTVGVAKSS